MMNSLYSNDRVTFVYFCHHLIKQTSRKYFTETFLDSYLNLLQQERYTGVLIQLVKTAPDFRITLEDHVHLTKFETFINGLRSEKTTRSSYIREVRNYIGD